MQHHYVYRITNLLTNEFYIGCRTCNFCFPEQDSDYWGSSHIMNKNIVHDMGINNFKKEIIAAFANREDAQECESEQIWNSGFSRIKNKSNPLLLNKNVQSKLFGTLGRKMTPDESASHSAWQIGKKLSEKSIERRQKTRKEKGIVPWLQTLSPEERKAQSMIGVAARKKKAEERKDAGIVRPGPCAGRIMPEEEKARRRGKKQSPEAIAKMLETRRQKGLKSPFANPEIVAKAAATRARNRALKENGASVNITISGD